MKARIIYLATLMMAMFVMSACNNEEEVNIDDDANFPAMSEEFKDNSVVIKSLITSVKEDKEFSHQERDGFRSYYECFHSLSDLENSPYASLADELSDIDWKAQTLIITYTYCNYIFNEEGCYVYKEKSKYSIEYKVCPLLGAAFDSKGVAIILNQPNIKKKDINFKISVAGLDY